LELHLKIKIEQHGSVVNEIENHQPRKCICNLALDVRCKCIRYYSTGNKEERINAWAQFISFIYFVEPNENSSTEYRQFIKHLQSYPKTGKHDDGHDDAEDAITEMLRYIWTKWHLFMNQNQ
jgi:hypothetical protein